MGRDILYVVYIICWIGIAAVVGETLLSATIALILVNAVPTYLWWSGRKASANG